MLAYIYMEFCLFHDCEFFIIVIINAIYKFEIFHIFILDAQCSNYRGDGGFPPLRLSVLYTLQWTALQRLVSSPITFS